MSVQPPSPGHEVAAPPLRPQGPPQQPLRPQPPSGAQLAGPPRPFIPGGAVAPTPRGPLPPRTSGPNSFAPQQPRPPQQGPPLQQSPIVQQLPQYQQNLNQVQYTPPLQQPLPPQQAPLPQQAPIRRQAPPPQYQPPPLEKQNSFQRPPPPFLTAASRQSSQISINPNPDIPAGQIRRYPMETEGTPPAVAKNRSFSIAGPPQNVQPVAPQYEEDRRRSVSGVGIRPDETVSRSPGLAFIKEGVQSQEMKESPLNIGLTRLSKEDITRSRESVRSDSSDGKGNNVVDRPESRLSGSRMTESIIGSLDSDERKNGSPQFRSRNMDDDDDVVIHNNKPNVVQNGSPLTNRPLMNQTQESYNKAVTGSPARQIERSPSFPKPDYNVEQRQNFVVQNKPDAPNRPPSALSNSSKSPEFIPKTSPVTQPMNQRPPSGITQNVEQRAETPEFRREEIRNATPDSMNGRPGSRAGAKPTDFGTPIKQAVQEERKQTYTRKAMSAPRTRREGDNDSGVDESTQGNEHVNGTPGSPGKKSPSKIPGLNKPGTPVGKSGVVRSPSKSAAPHTPNTPDSTTSNTSFEKKKVPMNKIQVGSAPSPNIKTVKSKIGSLENTTHKPGGGKIKIENRKVEFNNVTPRIAAKNDTYTPGGGDKKIQQKKLQWNAKSKIGSLDNAAHKPGGGDKKIETVKLDFKEKAKPKVASTVNITHKPGGGDVKCSNTKEGKNDIENQKLDIKAQSKVGSLDNVKHRPGGGDIKIFDDKEYLKQIAGSAHDVISSPSEEWDESITMQELAHRRQSVGPQSILILENNGSHRMTNQRPQRPRTAREPSAHRFRNLSPRKCQTPRMEYEKPPFKTY